MSKARLQQVLSNWCNAALMLCCSVALQYWRMIHKPRRVALELGCWIHDEIVLWWTWKLQRWCGDWLHYCSTVRWIALLQHFAMDCTTTTLCNGMHYYNTVWWITLLHHWAMDCITTALCDGLHYYRTGQWIALLYHWAMDCTTTALCDGLHYYSTVGWIVLLHYCEIYCTTTAQCVGLYYYSTVSFLHYCSTVRWIVLLQHCKIYCTAAVQCDGLYYCSTVRFIGLLQCCVTVQVVNYASRKHIYFLFQVWNLMLSYNLTICRPPGGTGYIIVKGLVL